MNRSRASFVIAIGKASLPMARAAQAARRSHYRRDVATNAVIGRVPERFKVFIGGHPLPSGQHRCSRIRPPVAVIGE
ncbi:MAG: DUF4147 domain-containing protein [Acidobacteria bacterium]|nr:DUF4147 domain-containing protein [Acidobacteriota bacterium]